MPLVKIGDLVEIRWRDNNVLEAGFQKNVKKLRPSLLKSSGYVVHRPAGNKQFWILSSDVPDEKETIDEKNRSGLILKVNVRRVRVVERY